MLLALFRIVAPMIGVGAILGFYFALKYFVDSVNFYFAVGVVTGMFFMLGLIWLAYPEELGRRPRR